MKDQNEKKIGNLKGQEIDTENVKGGLSRTQSPFQKLDREIKPTDFNRPESTGKGAGRSSK